LLIFKAQGCSFLQQSDQRRCFVLEFHFRTVSSNRDTPSYSCSVLVIPYLVGRPRHTICGMRPGRREEWFVYPTFHLSTATSESGLSKLLQDGEDGGDGCSLSWDTAPRPETVRVSHERFVNRQGIPFRLGWLALRRRTSVHTDVRVHLLGRSAPRPTSAFECLEAMCQTGGYQLVGSPSKKATSSGIRKGLDITSSCEQDKYG